ncbi:MAG: Mpo1-like protein [Acidobacteriota bacterium]
MEQNPDRSLYPRLREALFTFKKEYDEQHQTRINRQLHLIGRIIRLVGLVLLFFHLGYGLLLFFGGWFLQLLGHAKRQDFPVTGTKILTDEARSNLTGLLTRLIRVLYLTLPSVERHFVNTGYISHPCFRDKANESKPSQRAVLGR